MSLAKRINLVKNKYKDIDKVYNATISAEYDDSRGDFIGNLRLYINTPFKMAKIFYSGDVEILDTTYEGMSITNKNGVIYVMNYNKVSLSDDLLLQFLREIKKCIQKDIPFDHVWKNITPESIDYGLMEKSDDIFVIPGKFKWSDLGSWNALYDVLTKSKGENVVHGAGMVLSGENNLVHSNGRFTAIVGADNLAVINTEDATLVVPKEKVEHIKDLVSLLKKEGHENLL